MIVKSLKEYRKKLEEKVKREKGEEYFQKHKKFLDEQWEYLVWAGFILEDPELEEE
jgi:hypothetical protein